MSDTTNSNHMHKRYYPDGSYKMVPAPPPMDASNLPVGTGLVDKARQMILGTGNRLDQQIADEGG